MKVRSLLQRRSVRVLVPATFGLIVYGNWAAYVNRDTDHQLLSGIIEGSRAFTFTLIGNMLTEAIWSLTSRIKNLKLRIPTACVITWCIMQSIAFTIHSFINPDTALQTIMPSLIMSAIYVSAYMTGLSRIEAKPVL
ncbi:hypothetical protein [Pseudobacteriovorax antillogorgiicola]|uniref:Uncharacterized protein n=1 Tax=Pseudobacteriovorax antillogorgiicola TaxID=1513793 RepID=A0A1Y6BAL6_9BACT|nr:hypothetical protein [Pseudobacteriovorax antillogorgiicola]TCS57399.1 hypothetical protein EDD56_103139 [Pseudobacteriovorax antillogorgiicola]SMF01580.1 hypothetical protein SAMN06296036_103194 [Pseudobacteriovorax antillogorgiicola]